MTKMITMFDGTEQPVTDGWYADVIAPWPGFENIHRADAEALRNALMNASNDRELKQEEAAMLEAITHIINANSGYRYLQGRPHTDFGFDGIDQVHGQEHHTPCGCVVRSVFDHHKRGTPEAILHPHHTRRTCETHKHLAHDFKAHHAMVIADSHKFVAKVDEQTK